MSTLPTPPPVGRDADFPLSRERASALVTDERLGVFAGGVAHDFNNLLMGVLGNAELLLLDESLDDDARRCVEQIVGAGRRAADLTRQMLAYSGRGRFMVERISLNALVADVTDAAAATLPATTVLLVDLDPEPAFVDGDVRQLSEAIAALVLNAAEALDLACGSIAVTTEVTGHWVRLQVIDTGVGMDAELLAHIFEPFFTTKFAGRGLGLAGVHGIVRGHGGLIEVESEPGHGSAVTVTLPAVG